MDRGARWATIHGVTQSWTQLSTEKSLESGAQKGVHIMPVAWKGEVKSGAMPKQTKGNPDLGKIPTESTGSSLAHGLP